MDILSFGRSAEGHSPTSALDDYPDVDSGSCQLLGPIALVVQGLMGIMVISSLVYKRHREKPIRPWRIWLFDVSKQVVGQMFVHGVNVLISGVVAELTDRNACVFYFLNIGIDTTLGVGIIYGSLHGLTWLFTEKLGLKGFESGVYGNPPSIMYWMRQTAIYLTSLLIMKLVVIVMFVLIPGIFAAGEWLLSWTDIGEGDAFQVIFVMGIFPIVMNILQFWLIDSIVKASSPEPSVALDEQNPFDPYHPSDREPLFDASDDEEDGPRHRHRDIESQLSPRPSQTTFGSYDTGITTPDNAESKSLPDQRSTVIKQERHSYPPSLAGSSSNASSNEPREAKNLLKHDRRKVSPASPRLSHAPHRPNNHAPSTQAQIGHQPNDSWTVSWDEVEDDANWGDSMPAKVDGQEHDRHTHNAPVRARRLS